MGEKDSFRSDTIYPVCSGEVSPAGGMTKMPKVMVNTEGYKTNFSQTLDPQGASLLADLLRYHALVVLQYDCALDALYLPQKRCLQELVPKFQNPIMLAYDFGFPLLVL